MTDRDTGQPRGFAFVDLDNQRDVADACEKLNRQNFNGRTVVVNAARERPVDANNAPRPKQDRKPFVPKPPREPRRGGGKRRHDDNDDYGW
jgi:RNA recognition motif-containing protein